MRWRPIIIALSVILIDAAVIAKGGPKGLEDLLDKAEDTREDFCGNCLLWCRDPELAMEQANIYLPLPSVWRISTCMEACSTRIKGYIVQEHVEYLDRDDIPNIRHIREVFFDYAGRIHCTEGDYDPSFGTAEYYEKYLVRGSRWTREALERLPPERRKVVEEYLQKKKWDDEQGPTDQWSRNAFEDLPSKMRDLDLGSMFRQFSLPPTGTAPGSGRIKPQHLPLRLGPR